MSTLLPFTGALVVLLLLFTCSACDLLQPVPREVADYVAEQPEVEAIVVPDSLPLSKVTDLDSLERALSPILLSDHGRREFDSWFQRKSLWEDQIGSTDNLFKYIQYIQERFARKGEFSEAAQVAVSKGKAHYTLGRYPESIEDYQEALDYATEVSDSSSLAWAYFGLAVSTYRLEDSTEMEYYYEAMTRMAASSKDRGLQLSIQFYDVTLEISNGELEKAQGKMEAVINRAQKEGYVELAAYATLNLAYLHIQNNSFDQAIEILNAVTVAETQRQSIYTAFLTFDLYEAYVGKEEFDRAYTYLLEGCDISYAIDFGYGINFCKESMYQHFERKKDYEAAFYAMEDYHRLYKDQSGLEAKKELQMAKAKLLDRDQRLEIERLSRVEVEQRAKYRSKQNVLYGALALLAFFFLFFYQRLRYNNEINSIAQKESIAKTKLQVLQSQIQPHFVFNVITGIQNSILKSDPLKAYSYLGKFAALLRILTQSATSVSINLDKEVELIDNYLALEKLRFREDFVYEINVDESLLQKGHKIPGMMIQPMVENAIIHGVSKLPYQGEIIVKIEARGNGVQVNISDNGRGREAAALLAQKDPRQHLSVASTNREASMNYLRDIGYENASISINDLVAPDGSPAGTQVVLFLPFFYEPKVDI